MTPEGLMKSREQKVRFTKRMKDGETVTHTARIVTYVDLNKRTPRLVSLLTNNMEMRCHEIIAIYRKRWEIELLFKLLKQGFPPALLLRRECQCHQDTDMGYSQPLAHGHTKACQKDVELLRAGNNGEDHAYVLREPLHVP